MTQASAPATAPSWRRVEVALIDTARRLRAAFDHRLAVLDLNLSQASLLAFVTDFGDSNQTELAEMVGMGRAAIGSMIDQLEARGLVERNPHPTDRRVWLVGITDAGRTLVDEFYDVDADFRADIRRDITRAERQQLASLLDRLGANVDLILDSASNPTRAKPEEDRPRLGGSPKEADPDSGAARVAQ